MENSISQEPNIETDSLNESLISAEKDIGDYTPKLFVDSNETDNSIEDDTEYSENNETEKLFDQEIDSEEDFEIPAFLRRQKF